MIETRGCIHDSYSQFMFDPTWIVFLNYHACGTVWGGLWLHPRSTYDQSSNPEDEDILTVQWPYWFRHRFDFDIKTTCSWSLWITREYRFQRMDQLYIVIYGQNIWSLWKDWIDMIQVTSIDWSLSSIFTERIIHECSCDAVSWNPDPSTGRPKAGVPPGSLAHTPFGTICSPVEWATMFIFRIFEHEYKWSSEVETFWICWAETIRMCSQPEPLLWFMSQLKWIELSIDVCTRQFIIQISIQENFDIWFVHDRGCMLRITTRMVLLWLVATVRYVFLVTEQPLSSLMPWFPYVKFFRRVASLFVDHHHATLSGPHLGKKWNG